MTTAITRWLPHATVATIVEDNGRFLMVEENACNHVVFNQPAGHIEPNETIAQAALRETIEETRWRVELTHLIGLYIYTSPLNGETYHRHCFAAKPIEECSDRALDDGIIAAHWMTLDEIRALPNLRSRMVLQAIEDYQRGRQFPLDYIVEEIVAEERS